ncbi:hypothetical protein SARC_11634 [Sphaeroforma arctica JP610]|uniref:F-box domain-containing protein n=1 Tax=Sphaeroforma arctica JP610 TaxID=667725 RepID=A0A0L0FGD9_9EUKA|nr:hypothetical protein SARC_11634 [Sphaeroforma arctica JP610]KNC75849.1 hypothetical protein SARC_11634 [Sphaeroforma arctica JP610]|eukprot:XP_014149751.1 hypothetical protein SARC_11634 [Sphaeroforma arctica JP610]
MECMHINNDKKPILIGTIGMHNEDLIRLCGKIIPRDPMLLILSYLPPKNLLQIARTCKALHTLALDWSLWQRLPDYLYRYYFKHKGLLMFCAMDVVCSVLKQPSCSHLVEFRMPVIVDNRKLYTVQKDYEAYLDILVPLLPRVTSLDLSKCYYMDFELPLFCAYIQRFQPKVLNMGQIFNHADYLTNSVEKLTTATVLRVSICSPSLIELYAWGVPIQPTLDQCPKLRTLMLGGEGVAILDTAIWSASLTKIGVDAILTYDAVVLCPQLTEFSTLLWPVQFQCKTLTHVSIKRAENKELVNSFRVDTLHEFPLLTTLHLHEVAKHQTISSHSLLHLSIARVEGPLVLPQLLTIRVCQATSKLSEFLLSCGTVHTVELYEGNGRNPSRHELKQNYLTLSSRSVQRINFKNRYTPTLRQLRNLCANNRGLVRIHVFGCGRGWDAYEWNKFLNTWNDDSPFLVLRNMAEPPTYVRNALRSIRQVHFLSRDYDDLDDL